MSETPVKTEHALFTPFSTLLAVIDRPPAHLPSFFESAFEARLDALANFAAPDTPPSASSRAKVQSGKIEIGGKSIDVGPKERELALQASVRLAIDEVDAIRLLRSFRLDRDEDLALSSTAPEPTSGFWDDVLVFRFSERLAVLQIVQSALTNAMHESPSALVSVATAKLIERIPASKLVDVMSAFTRRARDALPEAVLQSGVRQAVFYAKQAVREQLALLHVAFLILFSRPTADAAAIKAVLDAADATAWGSHHERAASFDVEARVALQEVESMLVIVSVESLHLEAASDLLPPGPDDPQLASTEFLHPQHLGAIYEMVIAQASRHPVASAPLVLSWAALTQRLGDAFAERGVAPAYSAIASRLSGTQDGSETLARHALDAQTGLFAGLERVLAEPIVSGPVGTGCLEIVRGLIDAIPALCAPSFLPREQFGGLVKALARVYGHPSFGDARTRFWTTPVDARDERLQCEYAILDTAVARFPAETTELLHLVSALVGPIDDLLQLPDDADHEAITRSAFSAFDALPLLTHVLSPGASSFAPWSAAVADPMVITATRSFAITQHVRVPEGTQGRLVTQLGHQPVIVSWDLASSGGWSAWSLVGDMLHEYAGGSRRSAPASLDPFTGTDMTPHWRSSNMPVDVAASLELVRALLTHDIELARPLCARLNGSSPELVEVTTLVIAVLRQAMSDAHTEVAASAISILAMLLSSFPGAIWTQLGDPQLLFASQRQQSTYRASSKAMGANLLRADQVAGKYATTRAMLVLVAALFEDAQATAIGQDPALDSIRVEVLARALAWTRDVVWAAFNSWRYVDVRERFEIGRRTADIFAMAMAEAATPATSYPTRQGSADLVQSLLLRPTQQQLAPLLSVLADGPAIISSFTTSGRGLEALAAERYFYASLELALQLLAARRHLIGATPSAFEKRLLASQDVMPTLMHAAIHRDAMDDETRALSIAPAQVVAAAAVLSSDWPTSAAAPSLLGHLGSADDARRFLADLLELAGREVEHVDRRAALFDLMGAIVASQPGFAGLIISGEATHFASTPVKAGSIAAKMPDAIGVAQTVLAALMAEEDAEQAPLLLSVLRFLETVWHRLGDHAKALKMRREDAAFWTPLVDLAFRDVDGVAEVAVLRALAKAHACAVLAAELKYAGSSTSLKAVLDAFKSTAKANAAIVDAFRCALSPALQNRTKALLAGVSPTFDLAQCARPEAVDLALDVDGISSGRALYPLSTVQRRLERSGQPIDDVLDAVELVNANLALCKAQLAVIRAWRALLQSAGSAICADDALARSLLSIVPAVIEVISEPAPAVDATTIVHADRLSLLQSLLEATCGVEHIAQRDETTMLRVLAGLRSLLVSEDLSPIASLRRLSPTATPFHRQLFSSIYIVLRTLNPSDRVPSFGASKSAAGGAGTHALDDVVRVSVEATSLVLRSAPATVVDADRAELEADLRLSSAVLLQAARARGCPSPSVWLAYVIRTDLVGAALGTIVRMSGSRDRPTLAIHALSLLLGLAESPMVAERIAASDAVSALAANELTPLVEAGTLTPSIERSIEHQAWRLELALCVRLLGVVGAASTSFESEVAYFVRASTAQLTRALKWSINDPLPIALLDEIEATVALIRTLSAPPKRSALADAVLAPLVTESVTLLRTLVYALQHPNTLVGQLDPDHEERAWIDRDQDSVAAADLESLASRPVAGPVVQTVLGIICALVDALVAYTHAFRPLRTLEMDWPKDKLVIAAEATSEPGQPATIRTLTQLADYCSDSIAKLSAPSAAATPAPSRVYCPLPAFSRDLVRTVATHTLEATLVLATGQLALHLARPLDQRARRAIRGGLAKDLLDSIAAASRSTSRGANGQPTSPTLLRRSRGSAGSTGGDEASPLLRKLEAFVSSRIADK